jgi:AmmeMemoRadiSam system protein B/AmmeMemoRadiSam system protein A
MRTFGIILIIFAVAAAGTYFAFTSGDEPYKWTGGPIADDREVVAIVVPHAGYDFSAPVAGYGYAVLSQLDVETVFLIGSPHRVAVNGASVYDGAAYQTPLGKAEIDQTAGAALREADDRIGFSEAAHRPEHSLEIQVPFIQRSLPDAKIVPILYRQTVEGDDSKVADALVKVMTGRKAVIVISTDMSHFPGYEDAKKVDTATIEVMKKLDPQALRKNEKAQRGAGIKGLDCALCGLDAVVAGFIAAKKLGADKVHVLKYANSGDTAKGDKSGVVGYCAVALTRRKGTGPSGEAIKPKSTSASKLVRKAVYAGTWYPGSGKELKDLAAVVDGHITTAAKELGYRKKEAVMDGAAATELLTLARKTLEQVLDGKPVPSHEPKSDIAKEKLGCFVTLTVKKTHALRGCIGRFTDNATEPLYKIVQKMAVSAATEDSRFPTVTRKELDSLHIEISVLSKNVLIEKPLDLVPDKHGIVVAKGWRRGVYLVRR